MDNCAIKEPVNNPDDHGGHNETRRTQEQERRATSITRATVRAPRNRKYSQTFTQIRPLMSAFFCTASSRPSDGGFAAASKGGNDRPLPGCRMVPGGPAWPLWHSENLKRG
jgi:hypothetical protein